MKNRTTRPSRKEIERAEREFDEANRPGVSKQVSQAVQSAVYVISYSAEQLDKKIGMALEAIRPEIKGTPQEAVLDLVSDAVNAVWEELIAAHHTLFAEIYGQEPQP